MLGTPVYCYSTLVTMCTRTTGVVFRARFLGGGVGGTGRSIDA